MVARIFVFKNVIFEFSFDKFHKNYTQIYRIKGTRSLMCGPTITDNSPNIESFARLHPIYGNATVQIDEKIYNETKVFYSDNSLFEIFNFPFKHGSPFKALVEKNSVVISESTALRYYGNINVIDKSLILYGHSVLSGHPFRIYPDTF
jgi:putative ABC transport system permease protein